MFCTLFCFHRKWILVGARPCLCDYLEILSLEIEYRSKTVQKGWGIVLLRTSSMFNLMGFNRMKC